MTLRRQRVEVCNAPDKYCGGHERIAKRAVRLEETYGLRNVLETLLAMQEACEISVDL